jgi:hypothetical protein
MTRRRFGYVVWLVAFCVTIIPELLAASSTIDRHLPFCTISGTIGHLEYHYSWVALVVVAVIVFALVSLLRAPPQRTSGGHSSRGDRPHRSGGGRVTFTTGPGAQCSATTFDDDPTPWWFMLAALASFVLLAFATVAAREWWPDPAPAAGQTNAHFHAGYVLYGGIALLWFVVPAVYLAAAGKEAPFPTLFRTVINLEEWLRSRRWPLYLGPRSAWILVHVVVAGLVILLIHLVFYPFPDISHILNPSGQ